MHVKYADDFALEGVWRSEMVGTTYVRRNAFRPRRFAVPIILPRSPAKSNGKRPKGIDMSEIRTHASEENANHPNRGKYYILECVALDRSAIMPCQIAARLHSPLVAASETPTTTRRVLLKYTHISFDILHFQ